jgi:hypothetical protein
MPRNRLMTKHRYSMCESWGGEEARDPWFRRERARTTERPADAECLLRGALWYVARCFRLDRWSLFHKRMTYAWCAQLASELLHNTVDNVRSSMCLLPGWHTNDPMVVSHPLESSEEDMDVNSPEYDQYREELKAQPLGHYPERASEYWQENCGKQFFRMVARILLRETCRWWQQRRWHFWHWRFQVHPYQRLKRRFWERCDDCGVRFKGGTVYSSWAGNGKWCPACHSKAYKTQPVQRQAMP